MDNSYEENSISSDEEQIIKRQESKTAERIIIYSRSGFFGETISWDLCSGGRSDTGNQGIDQ